MPRVLAVALALALLPASAAYGQDASWFDPASSKSWVVERAKAATESGVITIRADSGWVRHRQVLADFVLKLDMRLVGPLSTASVYVRTWPASTPANTYGVLIRNPLPPGAAAEQADAWQHLEIECLGGKMVARIDGAVLYTREGISNPQGYIALAVSAGTAEFRSISIEKKRPPAPAPIGDAIVLGPGLEPPRALREVKPQYTARALAELIQGEVLLAVVVKADGTVGDVKVLQSLDPTHGLDREARAAAARWRFAPAKKDGRPVAVVVTIGLSFIHKRGTERTL